MANEELSNHSSETILRTDDHRVSSISENRLHLLTQDISTKIKAFALVFMVILHTFSYAGWWYSTPFPYSSFVAKCCLSFNICVAIFSFCSGYAFYFIKSKSIINSLIKLIKFYICCIICAAFVLILAILFCNYSDYGFPFWNNFLPLQGHANIMKYSWYTVFFCYLMILPPVFGAIERILNTYIKTALYILLLISINNFPTFAPYWGWTRLYASIAFFAYFFAKFNLFEKCYSFIKDFPPVCKLLVGIFLCVFAMTLYFYLPGIVFYSLKPLGGTAWVQPFVSSLSFIHTSICIFGMLLIIHVSWPPIINRIVTALGKHSMNIWLISAMFTSEITGPMLQTYVYTKFFPYTLVAVIFLCYLMSLVLTPLQKGILSILFKRKTIGTMQDG